MANIRVAGETRPTEQLLNDDGNTFQLEPNYTPEGGTFEPNYTPEGGPFETTEMPFEGESGFPTDGDLTSQPTVGNIFDKSSSTEKPVDIEDEDLFRGPIKCCNQAVCDFAVGPDSECVEQEGYIEECEQDGDSHVGTNASPRLAAPRLRGVCMCKPGYLLEDSGKCTQRWLKEKNEQEPKM